MGPEVLTLERKPMGAMFSEAGQANVISRLLAINEGPATAEDIMARTGKPLVEANGNVSVLDPAEAQAFVPESAVVAADPAPTEAENTSHFNRFTATKTRKVLSIALGTATLLAANAIKPDTAKAGLGLFGPKVTTVADANDSLDFRLGEDCSPVRDAIGKAMGLKSKTTQQEALTPERVDVTGKERVSNRVYTRSTGARGCGSEPIPNVHGSSTGFKYAINIEGLPKAVRASILARTVAIKRAAEGEWRQPKNSLLRGECGLQDIEKKPAPHHKHHVTPTFNINVSHHVAELIGIAQAQSKAEQSITFKCPDGATFSSHQKADAEAQALGLVVAGIEGKKDEVIKKTDLEGDNSWANVKIAIRKRAAALIAAVKAKADTSVSQDITGDCGPGPQPSPTVTATATASPSPSPTATPSPQPVHVVFEQQAPKFEGVDTNDPYTLCADADQPGLQWGFRLKFDRLAEPDANLDGDETTDIDGYDNPRKPGSNSRCIDLIADSQPHPDDETRVTVRNPQTGVSATATTGLYPIRQPQAAKSSSFRFNVNRTAGGQF